MLEVPLLVGSQCFPPPAVFMLKSRRQKSILPFFSLSLSCSYFMPAATHSAMPRGFLLSQKPVVLWIHDTGAMYNHDAVVNPEIFSNFSDGQLLRIHCPRNIQPQQQQSQSTGNDQQDQKKQHDHHQGQQTQVQTQQQAQAQQSEQSKSNQPEDHHHEQLDSVIVKGHAVDKESLAKQQQLQVGSVL